MSTKEAPGPFDGLERAAPGEPVFTLRAHDDQAVGLVREWVFQRRQAIIHGNMPDEKRELELIQAREAEAIAEAMEDWRNGQTAEVEAAKTPTYSGNDMSAEELAAKLRFDTIKRAAERFSNSVGEITEAAESLAPYGFDGERVEIDGIVGLLKVIAEAVKPKRASYAHRVAA
jgi:hypothetical protein